MPKPEALPVPVSSGGCASDSTMFSAKARHTTSEANHRGLAVTTIMPLLPVRTADQVRATTGDVQVIIRCPSLILGQLNATC